MHQPRTYRDWTHHSDLVRFNVRIEQTDLDIHARSSLQDKARRSVLKHRGSLLEYVRHHPLFLTTLEPYHVEPSAPAIVRAMAAAAELAGVGPMAAVAGAIAEATGRDLLRSSPELIVENGGDIFIKTLKRRLVAIYAGASSPFTGRIALDISPQETPLGICTSSGTIGHSLSLGEADAVIVLARPTALADAVATAIANRIHDMQDVAPVAQDWRGTQGLHGIVIIRGEHVAAHGKVKLATLGGN